MKKLLTLKHWQIFLIGFAVQAILPIVLVSISLAINNPDYTRYFLLSYMVPFLLLYFGWYYTAGTNFQKGLPPTVSMNLKLFKLLLFIPLVYIFIISSMMFGVFGDFSMGDQMLTPGFALIIFIHLLSMFCLLYCMYFIAKAMKAMELQRPVTFSDFAGELFLLWFFPIGIWLLQPRINLMFDPKLKSENLAEG
jgi:hypothetical protein